MVGHSVGKLEAGRCGFTLKSADGRSVELVPNTNKRCQSVEADAPQTETSTNGEKLQSGVEVKQTDCPWK